ncbi:hypothetical protein Avbf_13572 [Armadillidium vulgare]|nr:hypothetical protein Avbf_13572 [Armadillidium vulgare]
MSIQRPNFL